ncbi:efflux RND transporter periplasmic adaptor subunit [Chloroflexota bacterium]
MKSWRIVTVLLLCLVLVGSISCNPFGGEEETTQQLVEVVRGDLTVTVSGSGNIEVSNEAKLTFGVGGRIDKIYVEEGDNVTEGKVLAKLETDTLELALTQARVAQTQAQVAVTQAEVAVTQAEINLKNAEIALEQTDTTYSLSDFRVAQADVDEAERNLEETLLRWTKYDPGTPGYVGFQETVLQAQARFDTAEDKLEAMLLGFDTKEVAVKKLQVEAAEQSLVLAGQSLELTASQLKLTVQSLALAQQQLDEATITAPFSGIVASVPVDEKDTVITTTTIIHLIDHSSMKLEVQVDEIDVTEVEPGQRAIIEVDALPALPFEGKVSSISQLPTEEAGVIVYDVKIEFAVPEDVGIRAGMSASADIVIDERSNVLLVPDRAIKQDSQGNTIVGVMVDKQIEERVVVTGISDDFQIEIVNGLEEGEEVIGRQ